MLFRSMAFSAIQNNDKIGVIFFSDRIEKYIPPQKGKKHVLAIISELIQFEPVEKGTDIGRVLQYITNAQKKRCTTFLISDFVGKADYQNALNVASKKHDIVAIQVYDPREKSLPDVGLVKMRDAETGQTLWIDSSSRKVRDTYNKWWETSQQKVNDIFKDRKSVV